VSLRLVPLDCPSCGSALRGESLDTIFFCGHCGHGAVLEDEGLRLVASGALQPAPGRSAGEWRPAWLLETEVTVSDRVRTGGRRSDGWRAERVFVVPAFACALDDLTRLARALSQAAGSAAETPRAPIHGGVLALEDAVTLARHVVVGDEVRRSDMLASLTVEIALRASRLVAIPFERSAKGLRCAITGVAVRA
jgi:predicted RNA-binding Zn-ribbon protein involved in translation (DUF1610 family)